MSKTDTDEMQMSSKWLYTASFNQLYPNGVVLPSLLENGSDQEWSVDEPAIFS